jgi:hypothetical protein
VSEAEFVQATLPPLQGEVAPGPAEGEPRDRRQRRLDELGFRHAEVVEAIGAAARAEQLLRRPLTPDSAVQVALLKNRALQAPRCRA